MVQIILQMKQQYFPLEHLPQHLPQHPAGDGMLWWGGRMQMSTAGSGAGEDTEWLGNCLNWLTFASQKLREKALVFSDPGRGRVSPLRRWTQEYRINVEKPILKLCVV